MAGRLEAAGADFLVMACNAAHAFAPDIRASVRIPFVSIIEETVATELTQLGRGRYRAATRETLGAGEYALVLRPVTQKERPKRKSSEASLGELLGGGTSQILYFTWDFSVATL